MSTTTTTSPTTMRRADADADDDDDGNSGAGGGCDRHDAHPWRREPARQGVQPHPGPRRIESDLLSDVCLLFCSLLSAVSILSRQLRSLISSRSPVNSPAVVAFPSDLPAFHHHVDQPRPLRLSWTLI
eukprot:1245684-Rhodomonas_salina.3